MKAKNNDIIMQNKIFLWIAVFTAAVLSLPYLAMQFNLVKPDPNNPSDIGVYWTVLDFVVMGILLFSAGSFFVITARVTPRKYRTLIGMGTALALLYIWAELAVGIFTNLGS